MPFFNSNKVKIYYEITGQGEPVIFNHGFSLDSRMWCEQIDYFSHNYQALAIDARGHGKSEAPVTGYAREDRAEDILILANELKFEKFHLVGLSMGGGDALCFAIDHQDRLLSLTLVGTVAAGWKPRRKFKDYTSMSKDMGIETAKKKYIESTLRHYEKRNPELKKQLEIMMNDFSGQPWLDPMKGKYPIREDIKLSAKLAIPVLIVVGQHDLLVKSVAEQLNDIVPNSKLEVIKGIGHMVNLEAPELFNNLLRQFFMDVGQKQNNRG